MGIPYGASMGFATGIHLGPIWVLYGSSHIILPEKVFRQMITSLSPNPLDRPVDFIPNRDSYLLHMYQDA